MNSEFYIDYLYSLSKRGSKPGLERIKNALSDLGSPEDRLSVINVTGTNGKGSFCAMLGGVLSVNGYKTGVFSSPYLEKINECILIDGEYITDRELSLTAEKVYGVCEKHSLTQFEALTLICVVYFTEKGVDIAIMEVGMGGELDATNVFKKNILSVILGISLDHTSYLGNTTRDIAREKSGIIKHGCPVFSAVTDKDAEEIIEEKARELSSPLYTHKSSAVIISSDPENTVFERNGKVYTIKSGAEYQVKNAEKLLDCLEILKNRCYTVNDDKINEVFSSLTRPGRFEVFSKEPFVIFDGGHNPECSGALIKDIKRHFEDTKISVIMGVMADKDVDAICRDISEIAKVVYTVTPKNSRALESHILAEKFKDIKVSSFPACNFKKALELWKRDGAGDLLVVGSLYSYEEFKEEFNKIKE